MKQRLFIFLCSALLLPNIVYGGLTFKKGKFFKEETAPDFSVVEHFSRGVKAFEKKEWDLAIKHFMVVHVHYASSPLHQDTLFYLGVSFYHIREYEKANENLTVYINSQTRLKHYEEAFAYKFAIAEQYRLGAKKHLFGVKKMPKWLPAKTTAIDLYDEVIAALPHHDLTTKSFFSKGKLLAHIKDYRASVEAYQAVIKRFPRHELVPDAYLGISQVYHRQSQSEFQNPDLLALAQINLRNFYQDYPQDERTAQARANLQGMYELYAQGLYDTGRLYEKTKRPHASVIYYAHAIEKFPETQAAELSKQRLVNLKDQAKKLKISEEYFK